MDDPPDIDLEELVRQVRAKNPQPDEEVIEEVEEEEVVKEEDLNDMKSDIRSLHVMMEMVLEKLEDIETELKKRKVAEVDAEVTKKRTGMKKVTPDSKRLKPASAKICEFFDKNKYPTMTQHGGVTVYGTSKTGTIL